MMNNPTLHPQYEEFAREIIDLDQRYELSELDIAFFQNKYEFDLTGLDDLLFYAPSEITDMVPPHDEHIRPEQFADFIGDIQDSFNAWIATKKDHLTPGQIDIHLIETFRVYAEIIHYVSNLKCLEVPINGLYKINRIWERLFTGAPVGFTQHGMYLINVCEHNDMLRSNDHVRNAVAKYIMEIGEE